MGMQKSVQFSDAGPSWPAILEQFTQRGITPSLRMIDAMPAFPDEIPEPNWKELRLGFATGMVTIRREGSQWSCIVWGNAEAELLAAQSLVCEVIAAAGNGSICD